MSVRRRAAGAERMDAPDVDRTQLGRGLADLRAVNRWLGGRRVVLHLLGGMILRSPPGRVVRILDVATGSADLPVALVRWARARGRAVEVLATDNHAGTLAVARAAVAHEPCIRVVAADALALPVADGGVDLALCATALHHFDDVDAARVVREMDRVARSGWVVSDLRRSWPALVGAKLLAATVWRRNPVTRHDGPLSVRRSFTPHELRALAAEAGVVGAQVREHPVFRVSLTADRTGARHG
jgi:SAM-dependent methyltransferase